MLPSTQLRGNANDEYALLAPATPTAGSVSREPVAQAITRPDASGQISAGVAHRRFAIGPWMQTLGAVGVVLGSVGAGFVAHQMGYDWRLTAMIAALVGAAGGSAGMMLPVLVRAVYWTILAALLGVFGAAALYVLMRLAPAFVERIIG